MTRRNFLASIIQAGVAAAVLPSAVTYNRKWKVVKDSPIIQPKSVIVRPNPAYVSAPYEISWIWIGAEESEIKLIKSLPERNYLRRGEYGMFPRFNTLEDAEKGVNNICPFVLEEIS